MAPPTIPIEQRFAEKYEVDPESGCWLWTASIRANGYSQFRYSKAKNGYGHIFAYEHFIGPVPEGTTVDHLCRNRACVNPEHLEAVPHRVNVLRGEGEAAKNARKIHCKNGHPLSGKNLYVNRKTGRRTCRACMIEAQRRWRKAHPDYHRRYMREYTRRIRADAKRWRESQASS